MSLKGKEDSTIFRLSLKYDHTISVKYACTLQSPMTPQGDDVEEPVFNVHQEKH